MNYVSIYKQDTIEHINRHFQESKTVGSKFTVDKQSAGKILEQVEGQLAQRFGDLSENGDVPGRIEMKIEFDKPVGRQALISLEGYENETFKVVRDKGTPSESSVQVVLSLSKNIPETHTVTVIAGPYGNSGKWGIYTMFPGDDPGMPFPNDKQTPEMKQQCEQYWKTHGFLATPDEIRDILNHEEKNIMNLEDQNALRVQKHWDNFDTFDHYPDWLQQATKNYHDYTQPIIKQLEAFEQKTDGSTLKSIKTPSPATC